MPEEAKAVRDWKALRLSAVAAIPLTVWLVYSIAALRGADYATFTAWMSDPFNATPLLLFVLVTFYHAALGCREIIEDYVHRGTKAALRASDFFFLATALGCVACVLKIILKAGA